MVTHTASCSLEAAEATPTLRRAQPHASLTRPAASISAHIPRALDRPASVSRQNLASLTISSNCRTRIFSSKASSDHTPGQHTCRSGWGRPQPLSRHGTQCRAGRGVGVDVSCRCVASRRSSIHDVSCHQCASSIAQGSRSGSRAHLYQSPSRRSIYTMRRRSYTQRICYRHEGSETDVARLSSSCIELTAPLPTITCRRPAISGCASVRSGTLRLSVISTCCLTRQGRHGATSQCRSHRQGGMSSSRPERAREAPAFRLHFGGPAGPMGRTHPRGALTRQPPIYMTRSGALLLRHCHPCNSVGRGARPIHPKTNRYVTVCRARSEPYRE